MRVMLLLAFCWSVSLAALLPLVFEGNKAFSDSTLYESLGLRKPYSLEVWEDSPAIDPVAINQSVSAISTFYRSKGYFHNKISSKTEQNKLIIKIEENAPIVISTIQINSLLNIKKQLKLSEGALFDQDLFSETKSEIKKRYAQEGYCNAQFNSKAWVDIELDTAHLLFEAFPGEPCRFGPVSVESTSNIDGRLTESMIRFEEGDPYSLEAIKQSYEALYAQEGIAQVRINDVERNGSIVPVSVVIEESERPIRFSAGLGYSSDEGFTAQGGVKHRNFLGDLKTLSIDGRYSQLKQNISSTLSIPLESRASLAAEVGYVNDIFAGYKTQSTYEKVSAKYQDTPASAIIGLLVDRAKTYESQDLLAFPENNLMIFSPLGELNYDIRDKPLEPTKGYWLNAKAQGSMLTPGLSDATYFKLLLSGSYIFSIEDQVLAAKLKWGTLRVYQGELPSSYRFYAGGMYSNRAYMYRELGPKNIDGDPIGFNSLLEGTAEYRFPLYNAFRGVLFIDMTTVSDGFIPNYAQPYFGVGLGMRYVTPIGPVAIDFGIDPEESSQYAFHFRIGELF